MSASITRRCNEKFRAITQNVFPAAVLNASGVGDGTCQTVVGQVGDFDILCSTPNAKFYGILS